MKSFPFTLPSDESLIRLSCLVNAEKATLALDTAATQTTIDLNLILMSGLDIQDAVDKVWIETAIGPVEAYVFRLNRLVGLGILLRDFEVCAYDFLSKNVFTDIDGMLGLDFFKSRDLHISFKRFEIRVE